MISYITAKNFIWLNYHKSNLRPKWYSMFFICLFSAGLLQEITIIMIPVSIIVSCLFILMLTCLGGVVWSLLQKSPAHTKYGNAARLESPQKRRAAANVVVVVVPAVISYLPVLFIIPLVLYIYYGKASLNQAMCDAFESCVLFPKFGVLIGPMFYLSKARQMCCLSWTGKKFMNRDMVLISVLWYFHQYQWTVIVWHIILSFCELLYCKQSLVLLCCKQHDHHWTQLTSVSLSTEKICLLLNFL